MIHSPKKKYISYEFQCIRSKVKASASQLSYRSHGKSTICRGRFASTKCYQPTIVKTIIGAHIMKAQAA